MTLTFDRPLTETEIDRLRSATRASDALRVPTLVQQAYAREQNLQFKLSSEPEVGRLLSVLASAVPLHGRVLELGTGAGVGLAWIVTGLGTRDDVEVVSVEIDSRIADVVNAGPWPKWVNIVVGNAAGLVGALGSFDLIFADTPGGKIYNLNATIAALRQGGQLLLDDMEFPMDVDPIRRARLQSVRDQLFNDPGLCCAELGVATGLILTARRRS